MTETEIAAILARNVERLRLEHGWSKADLARQLKTHQSNVGRILKGHYPPSAKTIATVSEVFGVTVCELLCDQPMKKRKPS